MREADNYWRPGAGGRVSRRAGLRAGVLGGAGVAAALALACGGDTKNKDSGPSGGAGAGGQGTGTQAAAQQEQPRTGGIINQVNQTDPSPNLDLHQTTTFATVWPMAPCFNQLVQFDPNKPKNVPEDIVADLAEKWEQPDPTTLVFTLRKDVKWHDGTPFTSEDAKATFEWIKKPPQGKPSPRLGTQNAVEAYETPDPNTFRLKFSRPSPSYLMNAVTHYFAIGQAKDLVANGEVGKDGKVIGTGPFKLKSYQRSNFVELEKNSSYHIQGRPYLDGIKFFILPDYTTRLTNFIAGQYQLFYATEFLPSDQDRVKSEAGDRIETLQVQGYSRDPVFMNAERMPYSDIRVRQAISLAIDRDAAIKVVKQGGAVRGGYMKPGGAWAIPEADLRKYDGYDKPDLTKAKQLLAAAGVSTLEATATTRTDFKDFGELLKDQLAKVGINLKVNLADTATAQPVMINGQFDIGPWTISVNVDDPDAVFSELALGKGKAARNWSRVYDPQIDALFEKQSVILDTNERKKVVQDLERQAMSQYQIAVLYFQNLNFGRAKVVRNFTFHEGLYSNRRMESVWLKA